MQAQQVIERLFDAIDGCDAARFATFLADDVVFRFGNAEPVRGKAQVQQVVAGFFASIQTLRHEIDQTWQCDDAVICHGQVTYVRHDGTELTVPFADIFKMAADGLISEYIIFADISALYV